MVMSGNPIGAEDALRWGLVNRVVPLSELRAAAVALARDIAARGPLAVRAAREVMLQGLSVGLCEGLAAERRRFLDVMRTDDAIEGSDAFLAKRAPVYRGK
jgi:enoyl-CoA hydratase/carnithine racemase